MRQLIYLCEYKQIFWQKLFNFFGGASFAVILGKNQYSYNNLFLVEYSSLVPILFTECCMQVSLTLLRLKYATWW